METSFRSRGSLLRVLWTSGLLASGCNWTISSMLHLSEPMRVTLSIELLSGVYFPRKINLILLLNHPEFSRTLESTKISNSRGLYARVALELAARELGSVPRESATGQAA